MSCQRPRTSGEGLRKSAPADGRHWGALAAPQQAGDPEGRRPAGDAQRRKCTGGLRPRASSPGSTGIPRQWDGEAAVWSETHPQRPQAASKYQINCLTHINTRMNTQTEAPLREIEPESAPGTQEVKRHNDELGLTAIAKFGWLRPREIGNVLWARNKTRHVAGARVARRWLRERLVIERTLPYGLGNAYVLSQRGADYLSSETTYGDKFAVKTGKKIGDHINHAESAWVPTLSWKHDLLSNGFLTLVMGNGGRVISELELRRESKPGGKIPDGLYCIDSPREGWLAIETERAGKWSTSAKSVAASIVDSSLHGRVVCGRQVKATVLLYEDPRERHWRDETRPIFDHLGRMARQCQVIVPAGEQINLVGIPLVTSGGGVIDISVPVQKVIGWSEKAAIDKSVQVFDWVEYRGVHRLLIPESSGIVVTMYQDSQEWLVKVHLPGQLEAEEYGLGVNIKAVQAARQQAGKVISRLPIYRMWVSENIEFLRGRLQV